MKKRKLTKKFVAILTMVMMMFMFSGQVLLASPGAIWTSDVSGNVNINIYDSKEDVYLNGGPQNGGGGLEDGPYYVQITTPDGELLGSSVGSEPETIEVTNGVLPRTQLWSFLKDSEGKTGYATTTNNGGEYKVWVSKDPTFKNGNKTDNFKVALHPEISVTKSVDPTTARLGAEVTYTYQVENTGEIDLVNVTLVDDKLGTIDLDSETDATTIALNVGESKEVEVKHTLVEADFPNQASTLVNTVTATGFYGEDEQESVEDTASATVTLDTSTDPVAEITVTKTVDPTRAHLGDEVTYTYIVENTGDIDLVDVTLEDNKLGTIDLDSETDATTISLNVGESKEVDVIHTLVEADFPNEATTLDNTVTATGYYGEDKSQSVEDTASATVTLDTSTDPVAEITVTKTVDPTTARIGDEVTYTYTVENTGDFDLVDVTLEDNKLGTIDLDSETEATTISLNVGQSKEVSLPHVLVEGDFPEGRRTLVNIVTATGYYGENESKVQDTADAVLTLISSDAPVPSIDVEKTANKTTARIGESVTYTYKVTNNGEMNLFDVSLEDNKLGTIDLNTDSNEDTKIALEVGESVTVTETYTIKSGDLPLTNIATVTGYYDEGEGDFVTDEDQVTVRLRSSGGGSDPDPGKIEITKTIAGGGPQEDITFKLFKDGELLKRGETNAQGILLFEGLAAASDYTLEEVVPDGFKTDLDKNAKITVNENTTTKITVVNTPPAPPALEEPQPPEPPTDVAPIEEKKELPVTGGNPMTYLSLGTLALGIGSVLRKRS